MALILIVDDSQYQRNVIKRMVAPEGYEFLEATNGLAAMQLTTSRKPDCILIDKLMPDFDGIKFLHFIKQTNQVIPVIVVTADIQETTRDECIGLGALGVLNKPIKKDQLKEILRKALPATKEDTE